MSRRNTSEQGVITLPSDLPSETLGGARVAYELSGQDGAPVVVVQGGISAGHHVAAHAGAEQPGWWDGFVGPGRPIDTRRYRVLAVDFLGGCGGSRPGPRADVDRPPTTADEAEALCRALDALELQRVQTFVGASYGGMVGLAFAARYPQRLGRLVAISAPDRPHPRATAWRSLQRRIVRLGESMARSARAAGRDGPVPPGDEAQTCADPAHEALVLARALAMTTYRSAEELAERFDHPPRQTENGARFAVEDYLEHHGQSFAARFDAAAFLRLSEAIDLHRVHPARVRVPTTLIAVTSDALVPLVQLRELAGRLSGPCELIEVDSIYGHDAFLKEVQSIGGAIASAIAASSYASTSTEVAA